MHHHCLESEYPSDLEDPQPILESMSQPIKSLEIKAPHKNIQKSTSQEETTNPNNPWFGKV